MAWLVAGSAARAVGLLLALAAAAAAQQAGAAAAAPPPAAQATSAAQQATSQLAAAMQAAGVGPGPPVSSAGSQGAGGVPAGAVGTAAITLRDVQLGGLCQDGAPPVPLVELTIAGAHAAMLEGSLNCSALVAAYLQRIAAFDRRTQLAAVRAVNPGAAARAAALDEQLAQARRNASAPLPPLFCVPLLVKDNFDVAGMATLAGASGQRWLELPCLPVACLQMVVLFAIRSSAAPAECCCSHSMCGPLQAVRRCWTTCRPPTRTWWRGCSRRGPWCWPRRRWGSWPSSPPGACPGGMEARVDRCWGAAVQGPTAACTQ